MNENAAEGRAGRHWLRPEITDYGTLEELTADAGPLLMRHLGVGVAAAAVSTPVVPGGAAVGAETLVRAAGAPPADVAGDVAGDVASGDPAPAEGGAPGDAGVAGDSAAADPTAAATGAAAVAGGDELPFTGLDAAATAAAGAALTAAGVALRKATDEPPPPPRRAR